MEHPSLPYILTNARQDGRFAITSLILVSRVRLSTELPLYRLELRLRRGADRRAIRLLQARTHRAQLGLADRAAEEIREHEEVEWQDLEPRIALQWRRFDDPDALTALTEQLDGQPFLDTGVNGLAARTAAVVFGRVSPSRKA